MVAQAQPANTGDVGYAAGEADDEGQALAYACILVAGGAELEVLTANGSFRPRLCKNTFVQTQRSKSARKARSYTKSRSAD